MLSPFPIFHTAFIVTIFWKEKTIKGSTIRIPLKNNSYYTHLGIGIWKSLCLLPFGIINKFSPVGRDWHFISETVPPWLCLCFSMLGLSIGHPPGRGVALHSLANATLPCVWACSCTSFLLFGRQHVSWNTWLWSKFRKSRESKWETSRTSLSLVAVLN